MSHVSHVSHMHVNSKSNLSWNRYWALSDQGQDHSRPSKVFPYAAVQTIRSYNSTLVQTGKLILSMRAHLTIFHKIFKYCHSYMIFMNS